MWKGRTIDWNSLDSSENTVAFWLRLEQYSILFIFSHGESNGEIYEAHRENNLDKIIQDKMILTLNCKT